MRKYCALLIAMIAITLSAVGAIGAEAPPATGTPIADVRVEGRKAISLEKLPRLSTRPGMPFDARIVEEDVRTLFGSKKFLDVRPQFHQSPAGLVVVFQVVERPILEDVIYVGLGAYNDKTMLKKGTGLAKNSPADPYAVESQRSALEDYYRSKGYRYARITTVEGDKPGDTKAVFLITEGPRQRIWSTDFVGNTFMSGGRLKTYVEAKPGIMWYLGGEFDEKKLNNSVDSLTAMYRGFGFFQAKVGRQVRFHDDRDWVDVTFTINEGIRYKIRNISIVGNELFTTEELTKDFGVKSGDYFDQTTMNTDLANIRDLYGGHGYVMADVQVDTRFLEEPGELDLVFQIKEGDRYRVGNINIQINGDNTHTKRQVVLERLSQYPGDIVDIRKMRDDERRLQASQVFSDSMARGAPPPRIGFVTREDEEKKLADKNDRPSVSRGKKTGGTSRYQSPDGPEDVIVDPLEYEKLRTIQEIPKEIYLPGDVRDEHGRPVREVQQRVQDPHALRTPAEVYGHLPGAAGRVVSYQQAAAVPSVYGQPQYAEAYAPAAGQQPYVPAQQYTPTSSQQFDTTQQPVGYTQAPQQQTTMRPNWQPARQGEVPPPPTQPVLEWNAAPTTTVAPVVEPAQQPLDNQRWRPTVAPTEQPAPQPEASGSQSGQWQSRGKRLIIRGQSPDNTPPSSLRATGPAEQLRWGGQPTAQPQPVAQAVQYAAQPTPYAAQQTPHTAQAAHYAAPAQYATPTTGYIAQAPVVAPQAAMYPNTLQTAPGTPVYATPVAANYAVQNAAYTQNAAAAPGAGGAYTNPAVGMTTPYVQPVDNNPGRDFYNTPAGNGFRQANFQSPVEGGVFAPPPIATGAPSLSGPNPGQQMMITPSVPGDPSFLVEGDKTVDLDVAVSETQTGRIMFGAGVNSDAGLIGNILLEENNFDWRRFPSSWDDFRNGTAFRGAGEKFRMEAQPGTQVQRYLISWADPYLGGTPVAVNTSGYYFTRNYTSWLEQRVGGTIGLGYQLAPDLSVNGGFRGEDVEISNPVSPAPPSLTAVVGHNTLLTFQAGLRHDTRNNPYLATQGHLISLQFEQALGDFSFPQETIELRQYFLLNERPDRSGRHVLALGAKFGFSGSNTPIFENFFAGGFSTMRGFGFRGASPKELNVYVGGRFQMLYTAEYLFPMTADDTIRGVAFCDFGTTEQNITVNWDNFRIAPGLGLRVTVPALGPAPLAFDFAVPVHHAPGDDLELFSFWVGFQR